MSTGRHTGRLLTVHLAIFLILAACTRVPGIDTIASEPAPLAPETLLETIPTQESDPAASESGLAADDPSQADSTETCPGAETEAIGDSIARRFDVPYEQVIAWYCEGYEFEEILLALQTGEATDIPVEDMLDQRSQGLSWDEIWQQAGLIE